MSLRLVMAVLLVGCGEALLFSERPRRLHRRLFAPRLASEIDVSDLGLTMDDIEAPLPSEFFEGLTSTGYEAASRTVAGAEPDQGALWVETDRAIDVTLTIPGLRGQPSGALAVDMTETTATITAFGFAVWSCLLRGRAVPGSARVETSDGADMVPVVKISLDKQSAGVRWGGFIEQIGEDSLL